MTYDGFLAALRPEDRPGADEGVRRALAEHSDYAAQFHIQWPDGTWHWLASRGRGYYDPNGIPVRMEGVVFDITSRKTAEQNAVERQAELERAQAIAQLGSWYLEIETGRYFHSPQMSRLLGIPEDQRPELNLQRYYEFVIPEDRERVSQAWNDALQGRGYSLQYRIQTSAGLKWVASVAEVQSEAGRVVRITGTTQDITELKRAEEKLTRERLFNNAVTDSIPGLLFVYNKDERMIHWNRQHESLTGYSARELRGRHIIEWFAPEDHARIRATVKQAINTGNSQVEAELITRSGRRIPFYFTAHRLDIDGEPCVTGIGINLSDLKNTQRELAARTDELDRFFNLAPELLCITDQAGYFRRVNRVWERVLGYKVEELVNRNLLDFVHPEDLEATRVALRHLIAHPSIFSFVNRNRCKDGSYRWLEWHAVISGELGYAAAHDITERKAAEDALLHSEEQLRSFVQNAPFGISRASISEDRFVSANPVLIRMLGYDSEDEVLRLKLSRDIYRQPEDRTRFIAQLPEKGRFRGIEIQWIRKDGNLITISMSGRRLSSGEEDYDIVEALVEDISETRLLQEQFRQAQKLEAVGRLAGGVAHDFNNMLGVILGYSEIAAMELGPGHSAHARLDVIRKTCERAASLTSQLLAFSRRQVLQPRVVDLNDIVSETEKMLRRVIGEDVALDLNLSENLAHIKADPAQLVQIVMNLAINARDAMPDGGTLTIATETVNVVEKLPACKAPLTSCVALSVSDTGTGMDEETRSHIFEPFFTTKPLGKGTGLGLSTVYGIVQQSGGCISVDSQPGAGTTFTIYLPVHNAPLTPTVQSPAQDTPHGSHRTVLLVEDELSLRDAIAAQLEASGFTVLRAQEGNHALALAREHEGAIDLLITDIVMPRMRGQELAQQLQAMHPETRVLYMSGYADDLGTGSVDSQFFIEKPFRFSDIQHRVQEILAAPLEHFQS
jgi:PAS domain S-box-containing protein